MIQTRLKQVLRSHSLEALLAAIVLAGIVWFMIPRFLHQQLSYRFVVDSCNDLDEWTVKTGNWASENGHFITRPNPDGGTNWVLVHKQPVDPTLMEYPIVVRYDINLLETPDPQNSIWIGLGFGVPGSSAEHLRQNPLTPTLAAAVRLENGEFQGPLLYSRSTGWLGQYWEKQQTGGFTMSRSFVAGAPVPIPSPTASKDNFNPRSSYRIEGRLLKIDFKSGGVSYEGKTSRLPSVHWPLGNVQSPYVECFDSSCTGIVLFVYQSGNPIPITIDNIRVASQ